MDMIRTLKTGSVTMHWLNMFYMADVTHLLCELELVIQRVKLSTTPDGMVMDLFFVTDTRKKAVHKTTTTDDKRLQRTLKRIGVNLIPTIEEVNIFKDDVVIQFLNPKGTISQSFKQCSLIPK
ncbi:hypothetical protein M8C21_023311 [Ambrosia artemisiifolia]|uniref:Nascent polypeptide-associated complex subunit beta n=1 Tax=Ambrosia artemisiifolia TaxID=4212 RepID=A0AAD5DAI6_AMBAR|nr:hypothetical protein M8C21_023311 [Ambrosia artemisiifolia]